MSKQFMRVSESKHYRVKGHVTENDIIEMAIKLARRRFSRRRLLSNPADVKAYLAIKLSGLESETFNVIFLDTKHRILSFECMFQGSIDGSAVHPREVVKRSLEVNAAAVIFAHNHPSGEVSPSNADVQITNRLKEALSLVEVRVLDHLIAGGGETLSMAEQGYL